jgi:hypothetical protein
LLLEKDSFPTIYLSFTFQTAISLPTAFRGEPSIVAGLFADFNRCAREEFHRAPQRTKRKPLQKGAKNIAIPRRVQDRFFSHNDVS